MDTEGAFELLRAHQHLVILLVLSFALILKYLNQKPKGTPPGSLGLPIIGHSLYLGRDPRKPLLKLRDKYGPIFSIFIGPMLTVVVNDYETAKEAFLKHGDALSGRVHLFTLKAILTDPDQPGIIHGVINSEGRLWKEHRKFALTKLREFGMGKASLEHKISEEVCAVLNELHSHNGCPIDIQFIMTTSVSNIMCSIIFGERYDYNDEEFQFILKCQDDNFRKMSMFGIFQFYDVIKYLPFVSARIKRFMKNADSMFEFFDKKIEYCVKTFDSDNIRNLIDSYLQKLEMEGNQNGNNKFNLRELRYLIRDMFMAGSETTTTLMRWVFVYMLKHPDVMKKVQHEIDDVVGCNRLPKMADKLRMPYTEATLTEIQRCANILPIGEPHRSLARTTIKGFEIPANTQVLANMTAILNDPKHFENPELFNPDRFVDSEGRFSGSKQVAAFSVGRRMCLGETLARTELFLFFTSILQNFNIVLPDGAAEPSMDGTFGLTNLPNNDLIRFIRR